MKLSFELCQLLSSFVLCSLLLDETLGASSNPSVRVLPSASHSQRLLAAKKLLQETPLIDGHNDLAKNIRIFLQNKLRGFNFSSNLKSQNLWNKTILSQTDIPRLRKGRVSAQVWSTHIPCESQYLNAVQLLMEHVDIIRRIITSYKNDMRIAKSYDDIVTGFQEGRLASVIGIEGGHSLGSSMGVIRSLYELGVRSLTLTHRCHTPWAECAEKTVEKPNARGLTPFGKEIIAELNRIGMIIDLSHSSTHTAKDVLIKSQAPVIFSHSAVRAICDLTVNIPDDVIRLLARNGGVIMITFSAKYLTCEKNTSIADVIAHINHVRKIGGIGHVGLGAGYEGINRTPKGLSDVSFYPELFSELFKDPSWSLEDLRKLAGLNFLRVFAQVEKVRDAMLDSGPSEEIIPIHDIDTRWPCRYKFANLDRTTS